MASVSLTSFSPEVAPLVPGCADILILNAVRNAAIEFCEESTYWQETQDAFDVTANDLPYDLEAPTGARVCQILSCTVDGQPIDPAALDVLETHTNWRTLEGSQPSAYFQPNPDQFSLFPLPTGTNSVILRTAYCPTRTATSIESYVYQTQLVCIAAGALANLMEMPLQQWSNPELAQFYRAKFMQGIAAATVKANKSFNRANLTVAMRRFA